MTCVNGFPQKLSRKSQWSSPSASVRARSTRTPMAAWSGSSSRQNQAAKRRRPRSTGKKGATSSRLIVPPPPARRKFFSISARDRLPPEILSPKKYRSGGSFSGGGSGGIKTFAGRSFRIIAERRSTIKPTYSHFLVDNAPLLWIPFAPRFQKSARLRQNRADFPRPAGCALCISPPTIDLSRQA